MDFGLPQLGLQPLRLPSLLGRQDQGAYQLDEEEKSSLLKSLGSNLLSGLAAVGNLIDVPWSMGRDILAGENPLDQLLSPFSAENRTTGRQLLEKGGILGPNTPGFDWGDVAGAVVDIADPFLLPVSFPAQALTKAGLAAKGAGILGEASKVATETLGKGAVGWRRAQMLLSPKNIIESIPDAALRVKAEERFFEAAKGLGFRGEDLLNEKLGGLLGYGMPFKKPSFVIGKEGGLGEKIAGKLDVAGETLRHGKWSPIRPIANLFSRAGWSARTPEGFRAIDSALRGDEYSIAAGREFGNHGDYLIRNAGLHGSDDAIDRIWEVTEGVSPPKNEAEAAMRQFVREAKELAWRENKTWGLPSETLHDPAGIDYVSRQRTRQKLTSRGKAIFGVEGPEDLARDIALVGLRGGTGDLRKIGRSLAEAVRGGASAENVEAAIRRMVDEGTIREIMPITEAEVELIKNTSVGKTLAGELKKAGGKPLDRIKKLAKYIAKEDPDVLASGIFGNYPAFEWERWATSQAMKKAHAYEILRSLAGADRRGATLLKAPGELGKAESYSVEELVNKLGLNHGGIDPYGAPLDSEFYSRLGQALGPNRGMATDAAGNLTHDSLAALKEMRVPSGVAEDLGRLMEGWGKTPAALDEPLAFYDSFQNLWKALQTGGWPAFQLRNRLSGWLQEVLAGRAAAKYQAATRALVRGESSPVWKESAGVQRLAKQWGLDVAKLTDEQASDLARYVIRQYGATSPHAGEALQRVGESGSAAPTGAEDFAAQMTGGGLRGKYEPITGARIAKAYLGGEPGATWKPWSARGVFGETESGFPFVKAGELWGARGEAMNRVPGFFDLIDKGVDPVEAARQVGMAQVRYENRFYTPAEQLLLRVFPFGKYLRGQSEYVARELLGRPAGPMGTLIRATGKARGEDIAPEYVQQTASIPIPEGTPVIGPQAGGDLRYLSGFGLMHEDPIQFLGGGVRGALQELLSRTSPAIKGPIEWAGGTSFFQRGPEGGRELTEMDPTLGRTLRNVEQLVTGERGRTEAVKLPLWIEQLSANSPFSRLATTVRTLTDPRKTVTSDVPIPGPAAAINLLTGARVVDVPEGAQEAILREAATDTLRKSGVAKVFERTYVPKETLAQLPPETALEALRLQALLNLLAERAQKRARGETIGPINAARSW